MEKYVYITDIEQVKFYIKNGIQPLELTLSKNGWISYKYTKEETKNIYTKWKEIKHQNI